MTETLLPLGPPTTSSTPAVAPVTAVVVTRGRTPYLPTTLAALAAQTRRPLHVILVDAADQPTNGLAGDLERAFDEAGGLQRPRLLVLRTPGARTFGHAVRAALAADEGRAPAVAGGWLWLLHDDSAPASTALAELVRAVSRAPSVAVAGVKQRTWTEPERLLEVGLRTSRSGRRMTDVEHGELDQGQHDGRDDVLGVGLAGALVRRDVWDALRGPDAALGPFGDGFDLSRRARLAGHRVVVVPSAVVRHAQASYLGLRSHAAAEADLDGDGEDDNGDARRSFRARRRALIHQRLVTVPLPLVPVVALVALCAAVLRSLAQLAVKQPGLAVDELVAPLLALLQPVPIVRARARARAGRVLPRRTLRPLQAGWRDVWTQARDRRLARAEQRRVVRAPSELELRELAAIATRRRVTLGVVAAALVGAVVLGLGPLVGAVAGGARLVGGALAPATATFGELWHAATTGWVAGGLGAPGPADALLSVLLGPAALAGGSLEVAVATLLLGSVLLAGLGAWAAAGAATRSVAIRAWVALAWAAAPALLLSLGSGRLGAVVAHVALPWLALGLARAVGVHRVDQVVSGVLTARRDHADDLSAAALRDAALREPSEHDEADHASADAAPDAGEPDAGKPDAEPPGGDAHDGDPHDADPHDADPHDADAHDGDVPHQRAASAAAGTANQSPVTARAPGGAAAAAQPATGPAVDDGVPRLVGAPDATGSVGAAAGAALAFAVVVAGAPSLLVPGLLALLLVALCAPRHRVRPLAAAVPALLLLGPTLVEAVRRGLPGLRLLLADPGLPTAAAQQDAVSRLLGLPADATTVVPHVLPDAVAAVWPAALGAVVLLLAVLALLRGAPVARAVRLAWVVAALGLAAASVASPVGTDQGVLVRTWAGPGLSLALAGLLAAAALGADRVQTRLAGHTFGWRQLTVALLAVVATLVPVATLGGWAWQARDGEALGVRALEGSVVPAVGRHEQDSPLGSRVLALAPGPAGGAAGSADVTWQLMRSDGPALVDGAVAVTTLGVTGTGLGPAAVAATAQPDAATAEVQDLVARLAAGSATDVAPALAALGVSDVLVPSLPATLSDDDRLAGRRAHEELLSRLDSTPGLERVTQNDAGVLWRVEATAPAGEVAPEVVPAWARLTAATAAVDATDVVAVDSADRAVDTRIAAGKDDRLLVLAERSDAHWRAWLDGRPLRSVESGWRQTFEVGADGGHLVVRYEQPDRLAWLVAQGVVALVTVLLALPVRRRRGGVR